MNNKEEILETYKHAESLILKICKESPETAVSYIADFNRDKISYLKYLELPWYAKLWGRKSYKYF